MARRKKPKYKLKQRGNVIKNLKVIIKNQEIIKRLSNH